jgi:hypothetical protein
MDFGRLFDSLIGCGITFAKTLFYMLDGAHPQRSTWRGRRNHAAPAWSSHHRRRPTAAPTWGGMSASAGRAAPVIQPKSLQMHHQVNRQLTCCVHPAAPTSPHLDPAVTAYSRSRGVMRSSEAALLHLTNARWVAAFPRPRQGTYPKLAAPAKRGERACWRRSVYRGPQPHGSGRKAGLLAVLLCGMRAACWLHNGFLLMFFLRTGSVRARHRACARAVWRGAQRRDVMRVHATVPGRETPLPPARPDPTPAQADSPSSSLTPIPLPNV